MPIPSLASCTPVDQTAARVVSTGVHFQPDPKDINPRRSPAPLPITTRSLPLVTPSTPLYKIHEDLTGRVFGRLVVVGRFYDPHQEYKAWHPKIRWVTRCACGYYEPRRKSVLLAGELAGQMCSYCYLMEKAKVYKPARFAVEPLGKGYDNANQ